MSCCAIGGKAESLIRTKTKSSKLYFLGLYLSSSSTLLCLLRVCLSVFFFREESVKDLRNPRRRFKGKNQKGEREREEKEMSFGLSDGRVGLAFLCTAAHEFTKKKLTKIFLRKSIEPFFFVSEKEKKNQCFFVFLFFFLSL